MWQRILFKKSSVLANSRYYDFKSIILLFFKDNEDHDDDNKLDPDDKINSITVMICILVISIIVYFVLTATRLPKNLPEEYL